MGKPTYVGTNPKWKLLYYNDQADYDRLAAFFQCELSEVVRMMECNRDERMVRLSLNPSYESIEASGYRLEAARRMRRGTKNIVQRKCKYVAKKRLDGLLKPEVLCG